MSFIFAASIALVLSFLALIALGFVQLQSPLGILRDGLQRGERAPAWELPDASGSKRRVPSKQSWQLLLFADHSLKEFPGLVDGLRSLPFSESELEGLLLHRGGEEITRLTTQVVRLFALPLAVVATTAELYDEYNVRVMPFLLFLDPDGFSRGQGMVNDAESLLALWKAATVPLIPPALDQQEGRH